jgi:hypothetical protein
MANGGRDGEYRLAPPRAVLALVAGAGTAAVLVTIQWLRAVGQAFGLPFIESTGLHGALVIFVGAFVAWLAGLTLIGAPAWWLLHRHRLRGWRAAILVGMALTFIASMALAIPLPTRGTAYSSADRGGLTVVDNRLTAHGWAEAARKSLLVAFVGGAVGWVVWRTAYRRP